MAVPFASAWPPRCRTSTDSGTCARPARALGPGAERRPASARRRRLARSQPRVVAAVVSPYDPCGRLAVRLCLPTSQSWCERQEIVSNNLCFV
jgi:hypothetical protein